MRIYREDADLYIQQLIVALNKDPLSLEKWHCMHISVANQSPLTVREGDMARLKERHPDLDCDMVGCEDGDIFLICHDVSMLQIYDVAGELLKLSNHADGEECQLAVYDCFRDWQTLYEILFMKINDSHAPADFAEENAGSNVISMNQFGEVASLQEVLSDAKKRRKFRLPLHVMIVEDDAMTRRILTSQFKEHYALITAEDAHEAVANYLLHAPDIVFLDIGLPDASGFEVLQQILANDPQAYIVMFSANHYMDNVTRALAYGASGFVGKPFNKERMSHYINHSAFHHRKAYN